LRSSSLKRLSGQFSSDGAISQHILTLQLRQLEANGFVI
jgi:DNA-binding HxlR family transcriptional regulator